MIDAPQAEALLQNPNVQKYLRALRAAEGTDKDGADPYRVGFGHSTLTNLDAHPGTLKGFTDQSGKANKTSAAGAYQFLKPTWDELAGKMGLKDFSPRSQDIAAVALLERSGSLQDVMKGNYDAAISRDNKTWASLPGSPYNQKTRSMDFMRQALGQEQRFPSGPVKMADPGYLLPDGRSIRAQNSTEEQKLAEIHASAFDDGTKTRMVDLMRALPKAQVTDANLFGDDLPKQFDKDLMRLIETV